MSAKVLIAEDDPASRKLLQVWLSHDGYEITSVDNGKAALEAARRVLPDLVLSDVMMPEMDGFALCRELRADPYLGEVPIVLVTTLSDKASRLHGIEVGADDFLTKPYDQAELRARVRSIVRLNRYRLLLQEREQRAAERVQSAARLRELAELLDQTQDAIVQIDAAGQVTFWSAGAARLFGWFPEEAQGMAAASLLFPQTGRLPAEARTAVAHEGYWIAELTTHRRDGSEIILLTRWSAATRSEDGARSTLLIATDITEQRQAERRYLRAQRMETIGMLASGVAHDLNNMLTPIGIGLEILRQEIHSPALTEVLGMMTSSVERGAALVKQVLSLAREGSGTASLVQPKHILREVASIARETFPKIITVRTDYPPALRTIAGDPTELTQVLLNLCVNARDAMPHGGTLTLSARDLPAGDVARMHPAQPMSGESEHYVLLEVTDTGTGIPPELRERIFEPFFTTKPQGKGTGLGLATVASLVNKRGGFVTLDSDVGRGTTFRLYFPAIEVSEASSAAPEQGISGHGELILVAEAEASTLDLLRTVLETNGYTVITARDDAELAAGLAQHPAAAIIDAALPTVVQNRSALASLSTDLPLVGVCGEENETCRHRTEHLSVRVWLNKPFTASQVLRALREALKA
ncbi:response regulator [Chloracidobacterium sp. MS 40/45]|uniref:ATP-binding response regulator n=1 Tax=Chloracidobacterium aggregatum TaxID=2851959 RepID=UPI001B8C60E4|nr:response regulator [Chloracidobacterium aggregatum]QUW01644.1 response regulator [Chloracidobacterium sp. MS 40/45]